MNSQPNATARMLSMAAALWVGLFAFAFVAAPVSCEWGLSAYVYVGVAVLVALAAVPLVVPGSGQVLSRPWLAVILCMLGAVVWLAGLFAANVRIMCRLF